MLLLFIWLYPFFCKNIPFTDNFCLIVQVIFGLINRYLEKCEYVNIVHTTYARQKIENIKFCRSQLLKLKDIKKKKMSDMYPNTNTILILGFK